ncbi:MAG: cyclodeaminase/cyclohydrolase family protein [Oscillospiraceae bacterium]|nr:cyclodeaminase/cyclohydrolase family protein [Oscillospiraceae bacterium]
MEDMTKLTCRAFTEVLSSDAPVPGGGGAAALAGALAASLGGMVVSLTKGKKAYADAQEELAQLGGTCERLRLRLLDSVREDAECFAPLAAAYRMAKDDPARPAALETATENACSAPLAVMAACSEVICAAARLAEIGSRLAVSDAGCAASLAKAALESASLNVFINTGALRDREKAAALEEKAEEYLRFAPKAEAVLCAVRAAVGEKKTPAVWTGKPVADALNDSLRDRADALRKKGVEPTIALLRVGADPAAENYAASIRRRAAAATVSVREQTLPGTAKRDDVLGAIRALNGDDTVHGILLFLPLPKHLRGDEKAIRAALAPEKDVDGVTAQSAAGTYLGEQRGFTPCTAEACMKMLDFYGYDCTGKRAVVVGRSAVIGKPVSMLLLGRNATVTVCHTRTKDLASETKNADLVLATAGRAGLIGRGHLGPGAVVLDVGANWDAATGTLVGDLQPDAAEVTAAYTPVPGGVGVVTSTVLMEHVIEAAEAK